MQPQVWQAGSDDLAAVTEAFVAASLDEVVNAWIMAGDPAMEEAYRTTIGPQFVAKALATEEVWLAGTAEEIWAVSLWQTVTSADRFLAEAAEVRELLAAAPGVVSLQRMAAVSDALAARHPREFPHRYLHVIVTVPERRGQGAGAAILADRLKACSDAGESVFLEASTARSARLYARSGFAHEGDPIELPDGGPTLLPMWFRA